MTLPRAKASMETMTAIGSSLQTWARTRVCTQVLKQELVSLKIALAPNRSQDPVFGNGGLTETFRNWRTLVSGRHDYPPRSPARTIFLGKRLGATLIRVGQSRPFLARSLSSSSSLIVSLSGFVMLILFLILASGLENSLCRCGIK